MRTWLHGLCNLTNLVCDGDMEVITRAPERAGPGVVLDGEGLPPIRAFMDDLTILTPSTKAAEAILTKLDQLTARMGKDMKFKTKKSTWSRSLVLKQGKLADTYFTLCGDNIPTIQEQPVKSFGRWYTEELRDTKSVKETAHQVNGGLEAIDKSGLQES